MSKNTYKVGAKRKESGAGSVFSFIENKFSLQRFFESGKPLRFLPNALFLLAIGIFYIGNNHYTEKTLRKINRVEQQVEDLRADYSTLQAEYMHARLQSEVTKRVKKLDLKESETPNKKIVLVESEH